MKVSVLIPTYNRGYIIQEAVSSALKQTYQDFEILIVDDGSTDNTEHVVREMNDQRIRYLRHEKNRGYSAACNTAIKSAFGEGLAFLDSDDMWKPDNLEREVCFLKQHPEVDAVFTDTEILTGSAPIPSLIGLMKSFPRLLKQKPRGCEYVFTSRQMYLCLLEEVPIKPTALLVRRELYDKAGLFNEAWPSGTDWDLFLRFSRFTSFGYIDLPLAIQTWSQDATHKKFWEQDKIFLLEVFLGEKKKLRDDREALSAINRGIKSQYDILAHIYLNSGRRNKSIELYLRGFKESGDMGMLLRSVGALMPSRLRGALRDFKRLS